MAMVGAFIGIAIMLGVGIQILGNSQSDCTTLPDFVPVATVNGTQTAGGDANQTGWAGACISNNAQAQSAYTLLIIILIVVAAVAILFVVRML